MFARIPHTRLLRYAGLFTWAMVGLPLLYFWLRPPHEPGGENLAMPWQGWVAYVAFGAGYVWLTRNLGDRGPSLSERLSDRLDRISFASPFHRMRLKGRFPLKLIAVPEDPVPGDPAIAQRLKGGRLFRGGYGQGILDAAALQRFLGP